MWSGGDHLNDEGTPVLLFEPVMKKKTNTTRTKNQKIASCCPPTECSIGGRPTYFNNDREKITKQVMASSFTGTTELMEKEEGAVSNPKCPKCENELYLLLQLYSPLGEDEYGRITCFDEEGASEDCALDRTLYVFGCNRPSCAGHPGSFRCLRSQSRREQTPQTKSDEKEDASDEAKTLELTKPGEGMDNGTTTTEGGNSNADHWGLDGNDGDGGDGGGGTDWGETDDWGGVGDSGEGGGNTDSSNLADLETMLSSVNVAGEDKTADGTATNKEVKWKDSGVGDVCRNENNNGDAPNDSDPKDKGATTGGFFTAKMVDGASAAFPRYSLEWYDEPRGSGGGGGGCDLDDDDDDDDDDVGGHYAMGTVKKSKASDDHIAKMLQRYMAEEEDTDLVCTLRDAAGGGNSSGASTSRPRDGNKAIKNTTTTGGERDEKVPANVRAFLSFTDRMKRAPMQVVRYAYGGEPLWSAPPPPTAKKSNGGKKGDRAGGSSNKPHSSINVPPCSCGAKREFEFQLMPSLLHVLDVDSSNPREAAAPDDDVDGGNTTSIVNTAAGGGMTWGVVAVYSCSVSCDESREEYVIVQDAMDGGDASGVVMKRQVEGKNLDDVVVDGTVDGTTQ